MKLKTLNKLTLDALAIEAESASEAGTLSYMARAMVQATMPHKKTSELVHQRSNGDFRLTMMAAPDIGLPYGSTPRLMLAWIGSEAVKTQQRELVLGHSMSDFMRELGLLPTGGRWGSITRLKDQSARLFSCAVSTHYTDGKRFASKAAFGIGDADLWWTAKEPAQAGLFHSTLTLSAEFYDEITKAPVPVDMRVLKMLKRSPLALDVYCWLSYRIYTLNMARRPAVLIPWQALQMQFGAGYPMDTKQGQRNFKKSFIEQLKKVHALAYTDAKFEIDSLGLKLFKSPLALASDSRKTIV